MPDYSFSYEAYKDMSSLTDSEKNVLLAAQEITENAYAPYSQFKVGCAVLLEDGSIIKGTNVENASYPVGICAERTALAFVKSNYPHMSIKQIAISYTSGKQDKILFPCGMCRQFILECQTTNKQPIELILHAPLGGIIIIRDAGDLLPFGFSGEML